MRVLRQCRVCQGTTLVPWLDLGSQPLANALRDDPHDLQSTYPLIVMRCETCHHCQLSVVIDKRRLYDEYPYRSGVSDSFRHHCQGVVETALKWSTGLHRRILDIGANDGTLLQAFDLVDEPSLTGIEPAESLVHIMDQAGIRAIRGFFPEKCPTQESWDVITSMNVLGHQDDVVGFVSTIADGLTEKSVWICEVPWLGDLLETMAFDTIYHEHLSYWSLHSFLELVENRCGLRVVDVQHVPIHGGSMRLVVKKRGPTSSRVKAWRDDEAQWISRPDRYINFARTVEWSRDEFWSAYHACPGRWAAFGAAAKSTVFASYVGLTERHMAYVVDETPSKQGRWTPYGVRIVPPEHLLTDPIPPDYVLVFPWNFFAEMERKLRTWGYEGMIVRCIPTMEFSDRWLPSTQLVNR